MIRAKGFFWIGTRPQWVGELAQAGALVRHEAIGYWWATVLVQLARGRASRRPDRQDVARSRGDRRPEIVFIGTRDMDKAAIRAEELDACLLPLRRPAKSNTKNVDHPPRSVAEWRGTRRGRRRRIMREIGASV